MKKELPILVAAAAFLALAACIVPSSVFERASWGQPRDGWTDQGRYRQEAPPGAAPAQNAACAPAANPPSGQSAKPPLAPPSAALATDPALDSRAQVPGQDPKAASEPPLYAWDGGVVDGAPQGAVKEDGSTPRGLETPAAGRMHIIELYQQVLDERDALSEEVELLRKNLAQTTSALETKTREAENLSSQVAALEASHKELMADNQSIAARLVQAQIRRLEAEKLLLETRIEIEKAKADEAARAAQAQSKAQAKPGRPPAKKEEPKDGETGGGRE